MTTDVSLAPAAKLTPIVELARDKLGLPGDALAPCGHYQAKLSLAHLASLDQRPDGKLVLVTAISPTPAGEGKTTTTIVLGDALTRIGKRPVLALRELPTIHDSYTPLWNVVLPPVAIHRAAVAISLRDVDVFDDDPIADFVIDEASLRAAETAGEPYGIDTSEATAGLVLRVFIRVTPS